MPIRHGNGGKRYEDQLIRHIVEQIRGIPGSDLVVRELRAGNVSAVKKAHDLIKASNRLGAR